jgi:sulfur-oxidizing protein SoxY
LNSIKISQKIKGNNMERRKFLGLGLAGFAASILAPTALSAIDFRSTKPKVWTAKKVDAAIQELFGTTSAVEGGVEIKAPDIAENGAVVPVGIKTDLNAKVVALFQDANPESTVAVFEVTPRSIPEYDVRIKMSKTGNVIAIVQDASGKLHKVSKTVKVTKGGCGG